jgi:hypothetical protein
VAGDVLEGYVSLEKARNEYGVAIDLATNQPDRVETKKLRGK